MFQSRSRVARVFATAAVLTAAACGPERSPTAPVLPDDASLAAGGNGNGGGAKVKIKMLQLASTTLTVDGPSVVATISIGNTGVAIESGVSIIAEVAQPAAFHEAANVQTSCAAGAGSLPKGTCTMTFDVRASSSTAGAGTFESGPAVLRVRLLETAANGSTTELATKTADVNLVVVPSTTPSITSLTLANTTLTIEGPGISYTAKLLNPVAPLPNVTLQGWIVQGSSRYAAGGTTVMCGGLAVLPTGTCEVTSIAVASNQNSGVGLLVPGPATFELQLLQTVGGNTVLDTETLDVNLVAASPPTITGVTPAFTQLMIGGRRESVSIAMDNPGAQRSTALVKSWIVQGFARVAATDENVECGGASGLLPSGACTTVASVAVPPSSGGTFGLNPGSATLEVQLIQTDGTTETTLDTESITVTLVATTPWIAQSTVQPTIALGTSVQIAVIVSNPTTTDYPNSAVVVNVIQGGVSTQVASGAPGCGGSGVITSGDCIVTVTINLGSGFSPGAATVQLRLTTDSGARLLDVKEYDVTLVTP